LRPCRASAPRSSCGESTMYCQERSVAPSTSFRSAEAPAPPLPPCAPRSVGCCCAAAPRPGSSLRLAALPARLALLPVVASLLGLPSAAAASKVLQGGEAGGAQR
jgi:hypothetical protein